MEERRAPSSSAKPLDFALRRLGRRSHSAGEISEKMARAGYAPEEIRRTIDLLVEKGYLNDGIFAREVARTASERKHWGPARVKKKLRELRLPEADIEAAISEVFSEGEEEAAARALERFYRRVAPESGARGRARAYRHLLARGFSPSVAHRLVSSREFGDTGCS